MKLPIEKEIVAIDKLNQTWLGSRSRGGFVLSIRLGSELLTIVNPNQPIAGKIALSKIGGSEKLTIDKIALTYNSPIMLVPTKSHNHAEGTIDPILSIVSK